MALPRATTHSRLVYPAQAIFVLLLLCGHLVLLASPFHMLAMASPGGPMLESSPPMGTEPLGLVQLVGPQLNCFSRCLIEWNAAPAGFSSNLLAGLLPASWLPAQLELTVPAWVLPRALGPPPPIDLQVLWQVFRI
jgi:hypothetical protein